MTDRFSFPSTAEARCRTAGERLAPCPPHTGIAGIDLAIREQNARNQRRVHAMIAAPGLGVVLKDAGGDAAGGRLPGSAIAVRISDDKIGRGPEIRGSLINLGRRHARPLLRIGDGVSPRSRRPARAGRSIQPSTAAAFSGRHDDTLRFAAAQIQIAKPPRPQKRTRRVRGQSHAIERYSPSGSAPSSRVR